MILTAPVQQSERDPKSNSDFKEFLDDVKPIVVTAGLALGAGLSVGYLLSNKEKLKETQIQCEKLEEKIDRGYAEARYNCFSS